MTSAANATGWVDPGDGFLSLSRYHDGSISDAPDPRGANGYQVLADMATSHDSHAVSTDIDFADVKVWTAVASNGATDHDKTAHLVSASTANDRRPPVLVDAWFQADKPLATAATPAPGPLTVAPTEMQMGVADLVAAMTQFGQNPMAKGTDLSSDASGADVSRATASVGASNLTSQLVQALRQFDSYGNPVLPHAGQRSTVSGLAEYDTGKPADNIAGMLTVGKG
jgi:hypothetical protein